MIIVTDAAGHWRAENWEIVKPVLGGVNVPVIHMLLAAGVVPVVAAHAAKAMLGVQGAVGGVVGVLHAESEKVLRFADKPPETHASVAD